MKDLSEMFFSASPSQIARGYIQDMTSRNYICLICGHEAEPGRVYPLGDAFYDAESYIRHHREGEHGSMLEYLLGLDKSLTGLSGQQRSLLGLWASGRQDREIASEAGIAASTVRNHRFAFRERAKQARVLLAIMQLIDEGADAGERLVGIHRRATMVDERYVVTESEREEILGKYFDGGRLTEFPLKQKRKIIVLGRIAQDFQPGRRYSEKEANEVIRGFFDDYVTIRRYLIEYGFLDREPDGSAYWIKE